MNIKLLSVFIVIAAALPAVAETTTEENKAGKKTWDQPFHDPSLISAMEIPGEERTIDRNVPPVKMVATPQGERTIDRNVPPVKMVAAPQGERTINHPVPPVVKMKIPGEAKTPDMSIPPVVKVDPLGVGPAKGDVEDFILRREDQGPPVKANNPPIVKREAGEGWEFGQEYPPLPGQPIGLPPLVQIIANGELTQIPTAIMVAAIDALDAVDANLIIDNQTVQLTFVTAAGLTAVTLAKTAAARATVIGGFFAATAANASTMTEFYNSPEGLKYFLTELTPEEQFSELQHNPELAAKILEISKIID